MFLGKGVPIAQAGSDTTSGYELIKDIGLPLLSFLGGYLLSAWDRIRGSRRQTENMRVILSKELADNYRRLSGLWSPSDTLDEIARDPTRIELIASRCEELSSAVYEQFLGRMDNLKRIELDRFFEAYHIQRQAKQTAIEFSSALEKARQNGDYQQVHGSAAAVIFVADAALDKMFDALEVSTISKEDLAQLKANVGAELRRYHEVGAAINEGMKRGSVKEQGSLED